MSLKKALVALLVVAMVLGTIGPVFAAENSAAATRLQALGIVQGDDKGNLNEDQPVTRAEAAALVIRALGLSKSADLMKGTTKFADVNADPGLQWATGAINIAVSQGIINGYPNGQFGGRDQVTYAQFAKMMLYALNYGVTVEGGVWPTAVLAKADDLDLTDGLVVVADAPMVRGDVFKMVDNALDVPTLKQTGYGDLRTYEETGDTLLKKIGLDEIEGWVTKIPAVESKLDDDEVEIKLTKENGDDEVAGDLRIYSVLEGIDIASLFGVEVKAWVNDDDEIVFAEVQTDAKDIIYDSVVSADANEVELKVVDDTFDFAAAADMVGEWVNYDDEDDLAANMYGKFVLEKNEVVFYSVFSFESNTGVVIDVDDEVVKYFDKAGNDNRKLDLSDYDKVTVFNPDFTTATVDDIAKDSVLYWWENDDDELFIVKAGSIVEGKLNRVRDDEVTIDDTKYDVATGVATVSSDSDDEIDAYLDSGAPAAAALDLVGSDVEAILDINGEVRHLRGDSEATSGEAYGIATDAYRSGSDYVLRVVTADGEEVAYAVEERADWDPYYEYFETTFDIGNESTPYLPVVFELNSDGKIEEGTLKLIAPSSWLSFDGVEDFNKVGDDDDAFRGTVEAFDDDDDYIETEDGKFFVETSTVFFNLDSAGSGADFEWDDPEVVLWDDIKGSTVPSPSDVQVVTVGDPDLDFVVFVAGYENIADDVEYGIVLENPSYNGDDWVVEVDVAGEGKVEYVVAGRTTVQEGDMIAFKVRADGELRVEGSAINATDVGIAQRVTDDGKFLTVGGSTYKIATDAVVYSCEDDGDLDKKKDYTDIYGDPTEGDLILYLKDGSDIIRAVLIVTKVDPSLLD